MSTTLAKLDDQTTLALASNGDCSMLTAEQKLQYYKARCDAAGLDPRTQPLQFIRLNGKEVLYALKGATDQLAAHHGVRLEILGQSTEAGVRTVTVRAIARDGRQTDEIGSVAVEGLKGDNLCNAYMKAVTKAKRRAVLSICGLGMLDETELETIPDAEPALIEAASDSTVRVVTADSTKPVDAQAKADCGKLADHLKMSKSDRAALVKQYNGDYAAIRDVLAERIAAIQPIVEKFDAEVLSSENA